MQAEAIREYYIINGEIKSTEDQGIFEKIEGPIYEVIRVIDGVPLFLEDHLRRMFESADLVGYSLDREIKEIQSDMKELIEKNKVDKLNIKLLSAEVEGLGKVFMVYNLESFYPPEDYYKNGIHTIVFEHERDNPNAKVQMTNFRESVGKVLKDNGAFEALLVGKSGYIPEGSRSNMFFVKGDKIYTAPASEVLIGITRKHIFDVSEKLNLKIIEESIHVDDINKLDGAFMSGTSVNVLPISSIGEIKLESVNNKIIKEINRGYVELMMEYIKSHQEEWK